MKSIVGIIYRKELIDVLRDRRTLIFMLLLPLLFVPLLIGGFVKVTGSIQHSQALKVVRVAASEKDAEAYVRLVHRWFLAQPYAMDLRLATSPFAKALAGPKAADAMQAVPEEIFTDPHAFAEWTRKLVGDAENNAGEMLAKNGGNAEALEKSLKDIGSEKRDAFMTFYEVAIKGLALIEFVPATKFPPLPYIGPAGMEDHEAIPRRAVLGKQVDVWLELPPDFEARLASPGGQAVAKIIHDSTINLSGEAYERLRRALEEAGRSVVQARLAEQNLPAALLDPIKMSREDDLAKPGRRAMNLVGGLLPYFVLIFAFLGGLYPSFDLGVNEKEHLTLETLLLAPVSRTRIALGKFLVILTTSLLTALIGVISLALSAKWLMPKELMAMFAGALSPQMLGATALLALPAAAAFAGMLLAVSIFARTAKEAQTYVGPLNTLVILPAMAGLIPGLELNWKLAAIPMVNLSLISKDLLKGDLNWLYYAETLGSCGLFAGICIALAVWMFHRESALFRS